MSTRSQSVSRPRSARTSVSIGIDSRVCQNRTTGTNGMSRAEPATGTGLAAALGSTLAAGVGSTQPGASGATEAGGCRRRAGDWSGTGDGDGSALSSAGSGLQQVDRLATGGTGASVGGVDATGAVAAGLVVGRSAWASSMTASRRPPSGRAQRPADAAGDAAAVAAPRRRPRSADWPRERATRRPARPRSGPVR